MDERRYAEAFTHDLAQRRTDFHAKVAAVRQMLTDTQLDAVVLSYTRNFSWLTGGGRNFIDMVVDVGVGSIYVDATQVVLLTNEIEGHRLVHEELTGLEDHIKLHELPWYVPFDPLALARELSKSDKVAVDVKHPDVETRMSRLRLSLTPYEMSLYRALGNECGAIIGAVARRVRPSMTEWEVASDLTARCWAQGITPTVVLIAADERVDTNRHALPTHKRIKNKAMIVLCGRRAGFILSVTRMVYLTTTPGAQVPDDLLRRHEAATYVDAVAIASSVPGAVACDIFRAVQDAYAAKGFADEWKLHHQGGTAGYKGREWIATPHERAVVTKNQGFAWNPSITGTKSEDTMLMYDAPGGKIVHEIISETPDWPMIEHTVNGITVKRPGILHIAY